MKLILIFFLPIYSYWFAQETENEVFFEITFTPRTNNTIELQCKKGCNWENLTYRLSHPNQKQVIDKNGMFDKSNNATNEKGFFSFSIQKENDYFVLVSNEGTIWERLSFKEIINNPHLITERGVKYKKPE